MVVKRIVVMESFLLQSFQWLNPNVISLLLSKNFCCAFRITTNNRKTPEDLNACTLPKGTTRYKNPYIYWTITSLCATLINSSWWYKTFSVFHPFIYEAKRSTVTKRENIVNMHYPCSVNHNPPYSLYAVQDFLTLHSFFVCVLKWMQTAANK